MNLKPWRDIIVPHQEVLQGTYQDAEFAAKLGQVAAGTATQDYQNPVAFFENTFVTEGMRLLLSSVIQRLAGKGGDPVIQLKTAFGGGKTHTMLAVYHLATAKTAAKNLAGVSQILDQTHITDLPHANIVVLDGNAFSPSQPRTYDNTTVHTLWGEIAWQLGKEAGYALLAQADQEGTSPGKDILIKLFKTYAPCVILMDETVLYVRQFEESKHYSGGTFESNLSFLQALTEAATEVPTAVVLASLPESDIETGGARGEVVLAHLEKVFGRIEAVWKPVATQEGFEIVRRRLFGQITDTNARDTICRAFADLYVQNYEQFPNETVESLYFEQLKKSYPIHPEIFTRLYEDWATIDKFQRTRGVLRLMARAIHRLWNDDNRDLMIMPSSLPFYDINVSSELTRYLSQGWEPVLEKDIDGKYARPTQLDEQNPLLGNVQAARRVARTIFLGSAPTVKAQRIRGIDSKRIHLGCIQPEQQMGRYEDALSRLVDQLHYLYAGNDRYWYDTRPNLRREMEERMSRFKPEQLIPAIKKQLEKRLKGNPPYRKHIFTAHNDIPDDELVRLVVLPPTATHRNKNANSSAIELATTINKQRGEQPRQFQNRLVFMAADEKQQLWTQTQRHLAWESIITDSDALDMSQSQLKEAQQSHKQAVETLVAMLRESYAWILVPSQDTKPTGGVTELFWEEHRILPSSQTLTEAITKVLQHHESVIFKWAPVHLKPILTRYFWKETQPEVSTATLWNAFCCYPYLPRLLNSEVLKEAIAEGVKSQDFFAYATGKAGEDYQNLRFGKPGNIVIDQNSLLIQPTTAEAQLKREAAVNYRLEPESTSPFTREEKINDTSSPAHVITAKPPTTVKRFHGRVKLDAMNLNSEVPKIAEEIVQHFTTQYGHQVTITLEIEAYLPDGLKETIRRTVAENAHTLKFELAEFDEN
jgi:hypothetical protein